MGSRTARLYEMVDYISRVREFTIEKLAKEFKVSKSSIQRDLIDLQTDPHNVPLISTPGNGGGYKVMDGWYASGFNKKVKHEAEETAFLDDIMQYLPPEKRDRMQIFRDKYA